VPELDVAALAPRHATHEQERHGEHDQETRHDEDLEAKRSPAAQLWRGFDFGF
jgi:hypothetical protein